MGKALNTALNIGTGGALGDGPFGTSLGDTLFGKQDPGVAASLINTNSAEGQKYSTEALNQYGNALSNNTDQIAENQVQAGANQIRQNAADNEMKAKDLVAQRGLGNSSVGINSILNQKADVGNQIGALNSSLPALQDKLRKDNLNFAAGGIGNIMNSQNQGMVYNKAVASQGRLNGGIAPLLIAGGGVAAKAMG